MARRRADELHALAGPLLGRLEAAHAARETALAACRRTIRACGNAIRAVHRGEDEGARTSLVEAAAALREAQGALGAHPELAASGPLSDAEREYAEARLVAAFVADGDLPSAEELGVGVGPWLRGLAEAASELRRYILDRLRAGDDSRAEALLEAMDEVYALLVTVDYPDAVTGGLRRTTDALRAVLERTRGDLTTTVLQRRLQQAIERRMDGPR